MRPKIVLVLAGSLALAFGLALTLLPDAMMEGFGLAPSEAGLVLSRNLGVVLLAVAVLDLLAAHAPPGPALRAVLVGNLVVQGLQTGLDVLHLTTGKIAPAGWGGVVLHVGLGVLFVAALRRERRDAAGA